MREACREKFPMEVESESIPRPEPKSVPTSSQKGVADLADKVKVSMHSCGERITGVGHACYFSVFNGSEERLASIEVEFVAEKVRTRARPFGGLAALSPFDATLFEAVLPRFLGDQPSFHVVGFNGQQIEEGPSSEP